MVFLHQIFFVNPLVRKLPRRLIPFQALRAAEGDIAHLRHGGYMRSGMYGTVKIFLAAGADDAHKVFPMFVKAIIGALCERLRYFIFTLPFFYHFPSASVKDQCAVVADKGDAMVAAIRAVVDAQRGIPNDIE